MLHGEFVIYPVSTQSEDNSMHHLHTIPPTLQKGFFFFYPPLPICKPVGEAQTDQYSPTWLLQPCSHEVVRLWGDDCNIIPLGYLLYGGPQTRASQCRWTA